MSTYLNVLPDTQSSPSVKKKQNKTKHDDKRLGLRTWSRKWNDPAFQQHFAHLVCSLVVVCSVLQKSNLGLLQHRHYKRDDSRYRQKEKNDGHEEKNVQGPTNVLPKRLDVNVCVALGRHSGVRCLVFRNSVHTGQISPPSDPNSECAPAAQERLSMRSARTMSGFFIARRNDHTLSDTLEKRGSHGFPSRLLTHAPLLGCLHMMRENTTRRLSAALALLLRKRGSGKRNGGKENRLRPRNVPKYELHFYFSPPKRWSWQQHCCSEPPRTGEIHA